MLCIYIFEIYVKEIYVELILTSNSITWYFIDHVKYIIIVQFKKASIRILSYIFFIFLLSISLFFLTFLMSYVRFVQNILHYFGRNLLWKSTHSFLFERILFKNYEKFVVQ